MNPVLVINPFTQLQIDDFGCKLTSPKPRAGLETLYLEKTKDDDLYNLFEDLSHLRLDFLDIDNDLNQEERDLLYQYGVLVDADNIPERQMYSCQLNDLEGIDPTTSPSDYRVNPSFRYEPIDIGNFSSFAKDRNLLPYQPSVWVKTLVSNLEVGYWVNEEQSLFLSQLAPGGSVPTITDEDFLRKLVEAEIIIFDKEREKKRIEEHAEIKAACATFAKNKYVELQAIVPKHQLVAMQNYYRGYIDNGFMPFGDDQVEGRYYQHNEPLAKFLHVNLTRLMSLIAGQNIKPSYVYAASYISPADLKPHIDRLQCEFSFSFQIDYSPVLDGSPSPWGLFLKEPDTEIDPLIGLSSNSFAYENQAEDINPAVYLKPGDAVAYKGCELIHYRYPLSKGHKSTSLFFHYVPEDFEHGLS